MLMECSDVQLTVRQLSQLACSWVVPYIDADDYSNLSEIIEKVIHADVGDMEAFLHGLTAIIQNSEG